MRPAYELLRPPTDRRPRPGGWLHPYIRRLRIYRRRLRAGDPHVVASISLLAILVAAGSGFALTLRPAASVEAPVNRLAEAGPARLTAVRMLDAAPRGDACEEQTWPYIAHNCLKAGASKPQTAQAGSTPAGSIPAKPQTEAALVNPETPSAPAAAPQASEPSAPQQFASAQAVPLPLPRPQIEDDDELDQTYPLDEPRRMYGPQYGYPRGAYVPPYGTQEPRYYREGQRWQNYDERSSRRVRVRRDGIRIGDFYFRF